MIQFQENFDLQPYNSFGLKAAARYFTRIQSREDFLSLVTTKQYQQSPRLILGGGSNILFAKDFEGLVIRNELMGKLVTQETSDYVDVRVAAGENWQGLVEYCVSQHYGGLENLSLIPGKVGAAPIQNIGAYGVEVKDLLRSVTVWDLESGEEFECDHKACEFGYRDSAFKHQWKGKYFIAGVTFRLTKRDHKLRTEYGDIKATLAQMNVSSVTIEDVSRAVIAIRQRKLPDPLVLGNAGSFFKNPTITIEAFNALKELHPALPGYISETQTVKIPAGWLIEQCGYKGKRLGDAGVHALQALVIVNYGNASGQQLLDLARNIQRSVNDKFGIELTPEVNIIS